MSVIIAGKKRNLDIDLEKRNFWEYKSSFKILWSEIPKFFSSQLVLSFKKVNKNVLKILLVRKLCNDNFDLKKLKEK